MVAFQSITYIMNDAVLIGTQYANNCIKTRKGSYGGVTTFDLAVTQHHGLCSYKSNPCLPTLQATDYFSLSNGQVANVLI